MQYADIVYMRNKSQSLVHTSTWAAACLQVVVSTNCHSQWPCSRSRATPPHCLQICCLNIVSSPDSWSTASNDIANLLLIRQHQSFHYPVRQSHVERRQIQGLPYATSWDILAELKCPSMLPCRHDVHQITRHYQVACSIARQVMTYYILRA